MNVGSIAFYLNSLVGVLFLCFPLLFFLMYAVVRHTFELTIPEPFVKSSQKSFGDWKYKVWTFDTYEEASKFAFKLLLVEPLLRYDEQSYHNAMNSLAENGYYTLGKESIAIAEVEDKITSEDT